MPKVCIANVSLEPDMFCLVFFVICLNLQGCRDLLIILLSNIDRLPPELPLTCRKALTAVQQVEYVCTCKRVQLGYCALSSVDHGLYPG